MVRRLFFLFNLLFLLLPLPLLPPDPHVLASFLLTCIMSPFIFLKQGYCFTNEHQRDVGPLKEVSSHSVVLCFTYWKAYSLLLTRTHIPLLLNSEVPESDSVGSSLKCGINASSRLLEKGEAAVVLIANDVSPPALISHIHTLCVLQETPVAMVDCSSQDLGQAIGIKRVAVLAISKGSKYSEVSDAVLRFPATSIPDMPWLSITAHTLNPVSVSAVAPKRKKDDGKDDGEAKTQSKTSNGKKKLKV